MNFNISLNELSLENIGIWPKPIKIGTIILLSLVILFLGYKLDISQKLSEFNEAQNQEKTLKESFAMKQHLAVNLAAYQKQLIEIQKKFQFLLEQLPTRSEIPGLLEDISKSGTANGLEFRLFKPLPEKKNDFYSELPIDIAVVGTYHQIAEFISQVAFLDRIVTLHDFTLNILKDESANNVSAETTKKIDNNGKLLLEVKAKTYRYLAHGSVAKE